jgi:hypothetical protein
MIMIYYERPFIRIFWHEDVQCVEIEWRSFAFGEPYREGMNRVLELHRLKGCPRMLTDMRKGSVIVEDDTRWINEDWLPRAKAAGVRWIAVSLPASAVAQMQLEQLSRKARQTDLVKLGITTEFFKDYEAARRWALGSGQGPRR